MAGEDGFSIVGTSLDGTGLCSLMLERRAPPPIREVRTLGPDPVVRVVLCWNRFHLPPGTSHDLSLCAKPSYRHKQLETDDEGTPRRSHHPRGEPRRPTHAGRSGARGQG